jgi:hypothetical protein
MKTLSERLNFSEREEKEHAVKIDRRKDISYYETLCAYCANNDIDLTKVDDGDFDSAVFLLKEYGSANKFGPEIYYFWIDDDVSIDEIML